MGSLLLLLSVLGCSADPDAAPRFTTYDSAGITVAVSQAPLRIGGDAWRLAETPRLEVGGRDGPGGPLYRVRGVALLPDGRAVVANGGDNTLRFHAADGSFQRTSGGSGEGPGEFATLLGTAASDTTVYGFQFSLHPIQVFDDAGEWIRSVRPTALEGLTGASARGLLEDGSIVFASTPQGFPPREGVWIDSATVVAVHPDGSRSDTLGRFPGSAFVGIGRRGLRQEYAPRLAVAVGAEDVAVGFPDRFEVAVVDSDGDLRALLRWSGTRRPVTPQEREAYRTELMELGTESGGEVPEGLRRQRERMAEAMVFPDAHPAYGRLALDPDGNLWVERPVGPPSAGNGGAAAGQVWDVFDAGGRWTTTVDLPAGFMPTDFGSDEVAGVWRNALDEEFVRVYPILKGG